MTEEERLERNRAYQRAYYQRHKEKMIERSQRYRQENPHKVKEWNDKFKEQKIEYYHANKDHFSTTSKQWRRNNVERYLLQRARQRAKKHGLSIDITAVDISIPQYCPILGLKLKVSDGKLSDSSPSLDRIDSSLGYVKGNIHVISLRANRIKNDATVKELALIADYFSNL